MALSRLRAVAWALVLAAACGTVTSADEPADRPLADAVRGFNAQSAERAVGKEQPPLTEAEVVAAILWGDRDRKEPLTDAEYAALRRVAETRRLPAGWSFEALTGFRPDDRFEFEAWSVRIVLPRTGGESSGTYAYPIRERWLAARLIGPEERKAIAKWERRLARVGSFERVEIAKEYARERKEAAERDRSAGEVENEARETP